MRTIFTVIVTITLFIAISASINTKPVEESPPRTKDMELFCITPHGHQVYRYAIPEGEFVYVLIRHHDGYPIGITK